MRGKRTPFVESAIPPGKPISPRSRTMSTRSGRVVGSPPVMRIFSTPKSRRRRADRRISSRVRRCGSGRNFWSSGMQ